jgi:outer membrane protein assembly factor BamA
MNVLRLLSLALFVALSLAAMAQKHVVLMPADREMPKKWSRPVRIAAKEQVAPTVAEQISFLHAKGYLEASIDTCYTVGDTSTCPVALGKQYRWAKLSARGVPVEIASEAHFREKLYNGAPINPRQVDVLLKDLLRLSENNGHPFAKVWLDSLQEVDDGLMAVVRMEQGRQVRFDSVVVRGTAKTNDRYLQASIGIQPGDLYNESMVRAVEQRVRELPFVTQRQRPFVQFTPENTKLFLFLDAKKASSINGVLGLQPDATTGNITLTGDVDLRLRNALKRGEAIDLNWRSLQNSTQDLKIHGNLPFAFNTPFGIDGSLKLFKRDTSFLELNARGGLEYIIPQGDKITVFINSKSSDRLGSNALSQPGLADVSLLSYGLGGYRERYDYRFNPRRGYGYEIEGSTGKKSTSQAVFGQDDIPDPVKTTQYEVLGKVVGHIPFGKRSTLRLVAQGGSMVNDDLFLNELYRIGGLKTLRGADEASIYCSSYAIGTIEYRFVFEQNSNFFLFADQGWWENTAADGYINDTPFGFGVGTTFETKAGLFSLTYALGKQFNIPIELASGKVHFGFVSLF